MVPDSATAANQLQEANRQACQLLDNLCKDEKTDHFIHGYFVKKSHAMIFLWSVKVGVVLGYSGGGGFMLTRLADGSWSAPCFLNIDQGQAGLLAGFSQVETVMSATSTKVINEMIAGRKPVIAADLSVQAGGMFSKDITVDMNETDLITLSKGAGLMLDYSIKGGAISVDHDRNAEYYGNQVYTAALVMGDIKPPKELSPLYNKLNEIIMGKAGAA